MTGQPAALTTDGRDKTGFWTVVIGVPVLLSVLRLSVEAGGDLQTTLLLVAHVDPINLVAAVIVTGSWLASAIVVAALAVGGVLGASGPVGERMWLARWAAQAPPWVGAASFMIAVLTWQLLYLPLLLVAACAAYQLSPWSGGRPGRLWRSLSICAALAAYGVLIGPTLADAWRLTDPVPVTALALLAGPPLLALFVGGPLVPFAVRPFAFLAQVSALLLMGWAVVPLVTAPVLPLTVTQVAATEERDAPVEYVRGHIITTDDVNTVVLQQDGRVRYLDNDLIRTQDLCPGGEEIPRYRLRFVFPGVSPVSLEQSVLSGLGRAHRVFVPESTACRVRL